LVVPAFPTRRSSDLVLPRWAGPLALKTAVFITVMCCALAALLGVLVHVQVTDQTVGQARELALRRLAEATEAYEAGESLRAHAGGDPPGVPGELRRPAVSGGRGTVVAGRGGRPAKAAARPGSRPRGGWRRRPRRPSPGGRCAATRAWTRRRCRASCAG